MSNLSRLQRAIRSIQGLATLDSGRTSVSDAASAPSVQPVASSPRVTDAAVPDLVSASFLQDPFACYRRWQEQAPVIHLPNQDAWLVLAFDDVVTVMRDPARFSSSPYRSQSSQLLGNDPPDHPRVRRQLNAFFTRVRAEAQRTMVGDLVRQHLAPMVDRSSFDLVAEVLRPLFDAVNCAWLGVRPADASALRQELNDCPAWERFLAALTGDGLLAELIADGDWSQGDVMDLCRFFFLAGVTTMNDFLANVVCSLLEQPEWMAAIRANPTQIPPLVTEMLRVCPPVHNLFRQTTRSVEIAGTSIPSGAFVYVSIAAANRDPARFDQPDSLMLHRPPPRALGFGTGAHTCLGHELARVQAELFLDILVSTFPLLEPRQALESVEFTGAPTLRGPMALRVGFAAASGRPSPGVA
jgi:cytochrome P450